MTKSFGNTWWGEHWLKSLDHIDYENRLPRGASYARSGHVLSVKINDNQISAKVSGSRPSPYKVSIIIPPFFDTQIEPLVNEIIARPMVISRLLNRELDPEILHIAESLGLKVFPKQWSDFKMQCSCPDWAVPCKHLAAVVYMVSREIDNNPFLVFEMHKVNLLEELAKRGLFVDTTKSNAVVGLVELFKEMPTLKPSPFVPDNGYQRVDFSTLQPIGDALGQLLSPKPPFYNKGDFREKYAEMIQKQSKAVQRVFKNNIALNSFVFASSKAYQLQHRDTLQIVVDGQARWYAKTATDATVGSQDLLLQLWKMNPNQLFDFEPSVVALRSMVMGAMHLIYYGAIIPQIVQLHDKRYAIRWLPALLDAKVKEIFRQLQDTLPPQTLQYNEPSKKQKKDLDIPNQAHHLLSLFLTELISSISSNNSGDETVDLFFKSKPAHFDGVGESALAGGIKVWIEPLYLSIGQYRPVITITDDDTADFKMSFQVDDVNLADDEPVELQTILTSDRWNKSRFAVLQSISLLAPFIPGLDKHINQKARTPIGFKPAEFAPFLMQMLPAVRMLDIKVIMPKSLQEVFRPKPTIKIKPKTNAGNAFIRLDDLLAFEWQISLGDHIMDINDFNELLKKADHLFKFKENYFYVDADDIARLNKFFTKPRPLNAFNLLQAALAGEWEATPVLLTNEVKKMIKELTSEKEIPLPDHLDASLRPYQQRGFSWMYRNLKIGFGSIIADDMGLGKTLQVIALIQKIKEEGALSKKEKALVIVPTGLLTNWQAEIDRFAPGLTSFIYHGSQRDLKKFDADVMLTTYGVVRSDSDLLKKKHWQLLVIDEAQNIKNSDTAQSKAIKGIHSNARVAMSGTPVENRLSEFWSIFDFTNKGYLGNEKTFKEDFGDPIQLANDEHAIKRFRTITAPFMMRRLKSDKTIISDLPDKIEQNQYSILTGEQAALYQKTMKEAMKAIESMTTTDQQSLFKRQGLVLQMILALKQICNHPTQFLKNKKMDAELSGKTILLLDMLDSIMENNEKVLVFTQFREMGELLQHFITQRFGDQPLFYHGGCTIKQRQEMIDKFQNNRADKIFILSLKAAGTGLNLTAASQVIHYDLWWNPAVENQATDRAYRIGQTKNVQVHRFISKNTFEEKIDAMIQKKRQLADLTVASGESWIGQLSNKELREIFG